jgi:hypothetical protein
LRRLLCCVFVAAVLVPAAEAQQPLSLLDVPFISQSEALCGGAAAAMVLRYWGAQGLSAETFAPLVDKSAAGITTTALVADVQRRGFVAAGVRGDAEQIRGELTRGRPVIALIEDRPGTFHYIVLVGWHERGVVFHDPARAPFRVMSVDEFDRRWEKGDRWMLVVTPGGPPSTQGRPRVDPGSTPGQPRLDPGSTTGQTCAALVADGVREAQANRLDEAAQLLATAVGCGGSDALRELAGVRLLQQRWPDVDSLASAAVAQDSSDTYAWKLLGTARFIEDDPIGALKAWNHAGEPRVDLVRVDGLARTRQAVVERLAGISAGSLLSPETLQGAQRQVRELPAARFANVSYTPAPNGAAQLRVAVSERPLVPRAPIDWLAIGVTAAATRELAANISGATGGGEKITASWRFWPHRPRYALTATAPAPWGGTWSVTGLQEEQPFTGGTMAASRHAAAEVSAARWVSHSLRIELGSGFDTWDDRGSFGVARAGIRWLSSSERFDTQLAGRGWLGNSRFASLQLSAIARTSAEPRNFVLIGRFGTATATAATPLDQWPAGDTGSVRPLLLRGHPVLDSGRMRLDRVGRGVLAGSFEVQRWFGLPFVWFAPAVFADVARTSHRLTGNALDDVDVGGGVRIRIAAMTGTLRLDAG